MKVTGACHCGAIAFEAEVEPGTVGVCHCADCQKLTGTAFRANINARDFKLLRGAPKSYVKTADSGNQRVHAFCPDCGTPLYATALSAAPTSWSLRVGGLDQRHELGAPKYQFWTKRRHDWVGALDSVKAYEEQPFATFPEPRGAGDR
jgi:hypothetical protein